MGALGVRAVWQIPVRMVPLAPFISGVCVAIFTTTDQRVRRGAKNGELAFGRSTAFFRPAGTLEPVYL
eukprot:scaffold355687_cov63-Cyclotella_meneghiniana.AAC.4